MVALGPRYPGTFSINRVSTSRQLFLFFENIIWQKVSVKDDKKIPYSSALQCISSQSHIWLLSH